MSEIEKLWENELDVVSNELNGYHVLICRGEMGNLNGYIGITRQHPWFGLGFSNGKIGNVDVHGGLTFSGKVFHEHFKKKYWYFGFDTAHYNDIVPMMEETMKKLAGSSMLDFGSTYKDINYVTTETNNLYEQIKLKKDKNPDFKLNHKAEYRRLHKIKKGEVSAYN